MTSPRLLTAAERAELEAAGWTLYRQGWWLPPPEEQWFGDLAALRELRRRERAKAAHR